MTNAAKPTLAKVPTRADGFDSKGLVPGAWILRPRPYDSSPITKLEFRELDRIVRMVERPPRHVRITELRRSEVLKRFVEPVGLAVAHVHENQGISSQSGRRARTVVTNGIATAMYTRKVGYGQWTFDDWVDVTREIGEFRNTVMAVGYLVCGLPLHRTRGAHLKFVVFAESVFGPDLVHAQAQPVSDVLTQWGYSAITTSSELSPSKIRGSSGRAMVLLADAFLENRSPNLQDVTNDVLQGIRDRPGIHPNHRSVCTAVSRALHALGLVDTPLKKLTAGRAEEIGKRYYAGVHPDWAAWVRRALEVSLYTKKHSFTMRSAGKAMGLWLAEHHPEVTHPDQWTAEIAAGWVSAVNRSVIGQWGNILNNLKPELIGKPLQASTKACVLTSTRDFFRTLKRARLVSLPHLEIDEDFATPAAITRLIGPKPRDITQAAWMKLVWASLNLSDEDCAGVLYPPEFVRAVAVVWTHCGLRRDEIARLRVGCVRDVSDKVISEMVGEEGAKAARGICILDVPVGKTNTEDSKPVGKAAADAIRAWEAVRPSQPAKLDQKTKEYTHFLFSYRAFQVGLDFLNRSLIPLLCQKAGVPREDVPGRKITSHRGRASAATWYYNTRNGMTLEELQVWLGHKHIASTQRYVRPSRVRQAKRFAEMHANSYLVEVILDREVVESGAAARGHPWMFFPLGNGDSCANPFYAQCPHRMACPQCDFHVPAKSQKATALEAKKGIERMLMEMPLDEDERAAMEGGIAAFEKMLDKLNDIPTPDGRTPRQIRNRDACLPNPQTRGEGGPGESANPVPSITP